MVEFPFVLLKNAFVFELINHFLVSYIFPSFHFAEGKQKFEIKKVFLSTRKQVI